MVRRLRTPPPPPSTAIATGPPCARRSLCSGRRRPEMRPYGLRRQATRARSRGGRWAAARARAPARAPTALGPSRFGSSSSSRRRSRRSRSSSSSSSSRPGVGRPRPLHGVGRPRLDPVPAALGAPCRAGRATPARRSSSQLWGHLISRPTRQHTRPSPRMLTSSSTHSSSSLLSRRRRRGCTITHHLPPPQRRTSSRHRRMRAAVRVTVAPRLPVRSAWGGPTRGLPPPTHSPTVHAPQPKL